MLRLAAVLLALAAVGVAVVRLVQRRRLAAGEASWPPLTDVAPEVDQVPSPPVAPTAAPDTVPTDTAPADTAGRASVDPGDDGACPTSHPVKGKRSSGIFHVPGGLNYERTRADVCYRSPADAEADGLRASKV